MKKTLSILLVVVMTALCFTNVFAYQSEDTLEIGDVSADIKKAVSPLDTKDWTVCIYMCGTDLESSSSAATMDLLEMLDADIPDDVAVLVMTGGTETWNPMDYDQYYIEEGLLEEGAYLTPDTEHTQIYSVDDDKMNLVYTYEENFDMGDVCTLEEFLEFALYYAPSEHLMVSMWNHGGGPLSGVEFDEYTENHISIPEYTAFTEALYNARGEKTDIIGFDTCLIGNMEIALNAAPYADYMVASAEVEPGSGWLYDWLSVFDEAADENRTAHPVEIGERIIDTYPANEGLDWSRTTGLTLALYDLAKADDLVLAFEDLAIELKASLDNPELYSQISRRAEKVSRMYMGMDGLLDLYDFAYSTDDLLHASGPLMDTLGRIPEGDNTYCCKPDGEDTFVIYRGASPDYSRCLGITFFYPISRTYVGDEIQAGEMAAIYQTLNMTPAYNDFIYELLLRTDKLQYFKGELSLKYDYEREKIVIAVENPDDALALSKVDYTLIYTKINEDGSETSYDLGCSQVIDDWDNGIFEVPFDGKWYAIEGEIFTFEPAASNSVYDICWIPIVVDGNDELSLLSVFILKSDPDVAYLGQVYDIDPSGEADRSYHLDQDSKFRTVLIEENDYGANYKYYTYKVNDTLITPTVIETNGTEDLTVKIETVDLANSTDAIYEIQGRAWDSKAQLFYTNPMTLFLSRDISVFSIAPIEPQIYTGDPVTPKIGMRYLDKDILLTSDFQVSYENNVEKGFGKAIVKIDDEDLQGELVSEFEIKDVSEIYPGTTTDSWYFEELVQMQLAGAAPETKNLESTLTRGEFVNMLYHYVDPFSNQGEIAFTDIPEDSPYFSAVKWAKNAGIVQGITDKTFAPDKTITRAEMIVMLNRFDETRGSLLAATEPAQHLADCELLPLWSKNAVHWAIANGIVNGDNGYVLPDDFVTINEALAMISRCGK